jgi:glycosyltransferase involved in cell wall biosynthesis
VQKRLLFYYSGNRRTIALETVFEAMRRLGHQVTCLTTVPRGELHAELERHGIPCYAFRKQGFWLLPHYLAQARFLARFCRDHRIDTVWSHLQGANLSAVLAQFRTKSRIVVFRHHFHFIGSEGDARMRNTKERIVDWAVNRLAREIVVPSQTVYDAMMRFEAVDQRKLGVAAYVYDFSKYPAPNADRVRAIVASMPCRLRIIMVARLINLKRHAVVFPVFKRLIEEGLDIRVMVMDDGEERAALERYVEEHELTDRIVFLGHRDNVIDYMAAAHIMVHPSITEASNNAVKEAGLLRKAVVVQSGVGDFDAYIVDGENGFLAPTANPAEAFERTIRRLYDDESLLASVGAKLREAVINRFSPSPDALAAYTRYL